MNAHDILNNPFLNKGTAFTLEERKELGEKVERLIKFLNENKECEDFDLLAEQLHYMTGYYEVLTKRVSKLDK